MPLQHRSKYVGMEPPGEVGNSSDQYDYSFIPPAADPPVEPDVDEEKVRVPISRRKKSGLKLLCLVSLIAVVAFTQLAQTHWVVPSLDSLPALALKKVQTQKPVLAMIEDKEPNNVPVVAMIEDKEPNKVKKKKREMGYVTVLFEDTKHLCGALMMAWSLNDRDQFHDLVAVISGELDSPENFVFAKKVLQKAGFRLYDMPLLKGPTQKQHWFKYRYSKLNAFGIDDYEKLVFVDFDYFLPNGAPKELVSKFHGNPKPAALSNNCKGELCHSSCTGVNCKKKEDYPINSGFMVLQPNRTLLEDIKATIGKLHAEDESEQGFIDEYFKTVHQGFEYIEMDDELGQFKDNWEKEGPVPKEWKGLHFKGPQPWTCPRGLHCACSNKNRQHTVWPEADNLWWEHFDKMVKGWPWLLEDEQYKSICISDDSDCNWSPGAKLHVKQFKPKADSLAFVHIPRTGGGSIELSAVLKGLRWGVCNYWPTEGICNPEIKPGVNLTNFFGQQWFQVPQQWIPDEIPTFYEGHDLFAVVRSPYDRILSEFYWQCYAMEACNEDDKSTLSSASFMNNWIQMHMTTFAECPKVEKLNAKQPQDECQMMLQGHLIRQSDFIFDGLSLEKPMVEWVLHTENLEEEFASLMGEYNMDLELPSFKLHAAKSSILTVDDLDRKTIELINKVYKRDFKVFGYKMI